MITTEQRKARLKELVAEGLAIPASVYAALDQDRAPSDLLRSWHWSSYLWDRPVAKHYAGIENALASAQDAWDMAHQSVAGSLELRAERHAREAEAQRQREADDVAQRKQEADAIKDELRSRYLRMPGTNETEFEEQFPALLSDHRRQEMARNEEAGQRAIRNLLRSSL